jgi:hypothetical protein
MNFFIGDWDIDSAIMYGYLETMEIKGQRTRMPRQCSKKGEVGGSALFGCSWKQGWTSKGFKLNHPDFKPTPSPLYKNRFLTKTLIENEHMVDVFREYTNIYFPNFVWTQIQINHNFICSPHFDTTNVGISYLVAFGDYIGGETCILHNEADGYVKYDAREKPLIFNGSKFKHYTEEFSGGDRYSLVFFNNIKDPENKLI